MSGGEVAPLRKNVGGITVAPQQNDDDNNNAPLPSSSNRLDEADFVTNYEDRDLKRGLSQRHISLIAIAGAIGTGLFLGLGGSIATGGPLGALVCIKATAPYEL